jgi:hypothetical protein
VVILRTICGSGKANSIRESQVIHELYKQYNESEIFEVIQAGRLRWLGSICRKEDQDLAES